MTNDYYRGIIYKMSKLIMALSGPPGAGKSTYAKYLSENYGFCAIEGSDCLRRAAASLGRVLHTAADYESVARQQQLIVSESWIADQVMAQGGNRPLHVGLRTRQDFERIHQAGGFVVALTCPPEVCHARINEVAPSRFPTLESYLTQITLETSSDGYGSDTHWVIDHADCRIDTARPMEEVRIDLDRIVAELAGRLA